MRMPPAEKPRRAGKPVNTNSPPRKSVRRILVCSCSLPQRTSTKAAPYNAINGPNRIMKLIGSDRFSADTQHGAADEGKDPQEQDRPCEIRSLGSFEPVEKRNE